MRTFLVLTIALGLATLVATQSSSPAIRIVSPGNGTYISGPTRLVAVVEPPSAVAGVEQVTFYADGHLICTVDRVPFECNWDAGDEVVSHTVRVVATRRTGARLVDVVQTKKLDIAENVDVDIIQMTVVVTDGDGRFVTGLKQEAFRVFDDNVPQKITNFQSENIPLEMVCALDISSSMTEALPVLKRSAKDFLGRLKPADQVTALAFNDSPIRLFRRASISPERLKNIDRLEPWGATALYDVIIRGLDEVGHQVGRRSLVVFTDGADTASHATIDDVVRRVEGSDATMYMIGQGQATRTTDLQKLLQRLATLSGGRAFTTDHVDKLDQAFSEIFEDLSHQYLLGYAPPDHARDGALHKIRVEVADKKYRVRTRQSYRLTKR